MSADRCPCCRQVLPASAELIVDVEAGIVVRNGRFAALTRHEFEVFEALREGRVLSQQQLIARIYWQADEEPDAKIIDVYVCKIRKRLKPLGVEIQTIWGKGYRLLPTAAGKEAA